MSVFSSIKDLDFEQFIAQNRIEPSDFEKANITWENLKIIGLDHESLFEARKESAEFHAKIIQGCNKVHSVRWRVKSPEHLMEKIVRKRIPNTESYNGKYSDISVENYHEIITDLVGIRALHLFKDDYMEIDAYLKSNWIHTEKPIYYFRDGDDHDHISEIFDKKPHHAGYRSIHYIFSSQPLNKILFTEVQVRTIFEEGWSEIDHVVRYPNFSKDPHISTFLQIFNRLAGSADEMGSYAKYLVKELQDKTEEFNKLNLINQQLKNEHEKKVENLLGQLKDIDGDNLQKNALIAELEKELETQKNKNSNQPTIAMKTINDYFVNQIDPRTGVWLSAQEQALKAYAALPAIRPSFSGIIIDEMTATTSDRVNLGKMTTLPTDRANIVGLTATPNNLLTPFVQPKNKRNKNSKDEE